MIKAIDTYYNGNYFRSRLEAKWAVCFEMSSLRYEYELEGFCLPNGVKYLPDFYLPELESYVEVKPEYQFAEKKWQQITPFDISQHDDYLQKWLPFSEFKDLIVIVGNPGRFCCWQMKSEFFKHQLDKRIGPVMIVPIELGNISRESPAAIGANKKRFEYQ